MCKHNIEQPSLTLHQQLVTKDAIAAQGSRRRRLWNLSTKSHCPVVGVCIPLMRLRKLVSKSISQELHSDDYEIHVGTVAECATRNALSESLQRELEERYAGAVRHFKSAKTAEAVWELWAQAVNQGDVAGPFWAALTHPRCDEALEDGLCRDMHMIQHQAGASVRVEMSKFKALQQQKAALSQELVHSQQRHVRSITERTAEIERLNTASFNLQKELVSKDATIAALQQELAELRATIPELEVRARLHQKTMQMAHRQNEMETEIRDLKQKLATATHQLANNESTTPIDIGAQHNAGAKLEARAVPITLHDRKVLCVGGRTGSVATYRELVAQIGGQFAYHDGGLEDNQNKLDANLAAADLVICQTGCISHNAYWRVKDFCKRNGKRCIFVENPSASSFGKKLEEALLEA